MRRFTELEMETMSVEELDVHYQEVHQQPDVSGTYLDRVLYWRCERVYQEFVEAEAAEVAEAAEDAFAAESLSAMLTNPSVNWQREGF